MYSSIRQTEYSHSCGMQTQFIPSEIIGQSSELVIQTLYKLKYVIYIYIYIYAASVGQYSLFVFMVPMLHAVIICRNSSIGGWRENIFSNFSYQNISVIKHISFPDTLSSNLFGELTFYMLSN